MSPYRALVVGGGAREHALVAALARSPRIRDGGEILALPGNAGTIREARAVAASANDVAAIVDVARGERVDLVVVGPEGPLVEGVVDRLRGAGIVAFGPDRGAAELEGSKAFAKRFMARHGIPTAPFEVFDDATAAERYVQSAGRPLVVKADGLAAGKGVVVAGDVAEACDAIDAILRKEAFGEAGRTVVIEERLAGEEISFHALCDGRHFVPLAAAQDHKRAYDGDRGPNTGGMGAYSSDDLLSARLQRRILREVIAPAVAGLAREGRPFRGALFAGLMLGPPDATGERPFHVLEFNARFGDPETAVLLARLDDDLLPYLEGASRGDLASVPGGAPEDATPSGGPRVGREAAVAVVMAASGYPGAARSGDRITGLEAAGAIEGVAVLHAGTSHRGGDVVTNGGRVLCVTARGVDVDRAAARAYEAVGKIGFDGAHYRRDIALRARLGAR